MGPRFDAAGCTSTRYFQCENDKRPQAAAQSGPTGLRDRTAELLAKYQHRNLGPSSAFLRKPTFPMEPEAGSIIEFYDTLASSGTWHMDQGRWVLSWTLREPGASQAEHERAVFGDDGLETMFVDGQRLADNDLLAFMAAMMASRIQ